MTEQIIFIEQHELSENAEYVMPLLLKAVKR